MTTPLDCVTSDTRIFFGGSISRQSSDQRENTQKAIMRIQKIVCIFCVACVVEWNKFLFLLRIFLFSLSSYVLKYLLSLLPWFVSEEANYGMVKNCLLESTYLCACSFLNNNEAILCYCPFPEYFFSSRISWQLISQITVLICPTSKLYSCPQS